jgi:CHAT domain-containing protein
VSTASSPTAREAALEELRELEREYETLVTRIRRDNPAYASLAHPRVLSAAEISDTLGGDEALVEFVITETQGFAWIVRRDSIHGYRVPGAKALDPQVRLLRALLTARDDRATERLGAQLFEKLLGPGAAELDGVKRLIVVPDGVLQRLPFALLRSNDRWLIETHALALAPSATILQFLRQPRTARAPKPLLALAAPEAGETAVFDGEAGALGALTHATDEVHHAIRVVGATADSARVGPEATEAVLKSSEAAQYRIVHLAAHAVADEIVPRRSAIMLASVGDEDGLLQVQEIANLSLNADLVVLAACRSNVGRLVRAEGLLSLSRAFMHAGARAVVATAWAIPDRDTAWLMGRFYSAIGRGLAPDEALRQAQLEALGSRGSRAAPGTWGAFLVSGDARTPILDAPLRSGSWTWALLVGAIIAGLAVRFRLRS